MVALERKERGEAALFVLCLAAVPIVMLLAQIRLDSARARGARREANIPERKIVIGWSASSST